MERTTKVALIGTGWISKKMLDATRVVEGIEVVGIYSRDVEKTIRIALDWGVDHVYQSLDELMDDDFDFVYLATSTKNHDSVLQKLIARHIPVLCEKPIAVNLKQYKAMIESSSKNNTHVMEAMKSMYTPNFIQLKSSLHLIGNPVRVSFTFERPSAPVEDDCYRSALLDIGVYPIAMSVALFGEPEGIESRLKVTANKMDTDGQIVLNYNGFDVRIDYSKEVLSDNVNRIIGTEGTLLFDHVSEVRTLKYLDHRGNKEDLAVVTNPNTLVYELMYMRELVDCDNLAVIERKDQIECVFKIMDSIRLQHHIDFIED